MKKQYRELDARSECIDAIYGSCMHDFPMCFVYIHSTSIKNAYTFVYIVVILRHKNAVKLTEIYTSLMNLSYLERVTILSFLPQL